MSIIERIMLVLCLCGAVFLTAGCPEGTEPALSDRAVVLSAEPAETEKFAAQVLSAYLSDLSGASCPVIDQSTPFDGFSYYIGGAYSESTMETEGRLDGSYTLLPLDNGLAIFGAGNRGTIYGVYGYLEDYCGYRDFTASAGMQSVTGKITLPESRVDFETSFEFTDTDWSSPLDTEYSLANGLNAGTRRTLDPVQGGAVSYLGDFCHTLSNMFCSGETYFESHPEYFALYEGERIPWQLCLSNEDTYQVVIGEVMDLLKQGHDPSADLQIISLSQADNPYYCQCDSCRALEEKGGSPSYPILAFVNRAARDVRDAGYDNVAIDTFAYLYSRKAPSGIVPEGNVIVRLCSLECCFSHPLEDASCPENAAFKEDLEAWSQICSRLYIWDYTTNYGSTLGIFPDFHVLQANIQYFLSHGVKGVYEEGNYYMATCDTEFGELRSYLISRLLRDPFCDFEKEKELFCNAYYGKGGPFIVQFLDRITAACGGKHVTIYSPMIESFTISEKEAEEMDRLWDKAERAAGSDKTARKNLERSRLSWRYVKAALSLREFAGHLDNTVAVREQLYKDLIAHGVEQIDEWNPISPDFGPYRLIPVEEWAYASIIHILYYDANGGKGAPGSQWSNGYLEISLDQPVRKGYEFLGWSPDRYAARAMYEPGGYFTLTDDLTLYAVWRAK